MNAFPTCFGFARIAANHITDMLYVRQMAETFLSTLSLMFISSRYFIHNARRDTESDIVIQTTLQHVLVKRFKKNKKLDEKNNLEQRHKNVAKRANSSRRMI